MRNAASVKERLKNYAKAAGRTVQDVFTIYVLERTLYRLSVSEYADRFTLKGGILLYGIFTEDFARATTDIDLLGMNIANEAESMKHVFEKIFSIKADDPIVFGIDTLEVSNITEFRKYPGINVSIMAFLDRTRIPVHIDIGFGDSIYPERIRMDYPAILDDEPAKLYVYSLESMIAEKFEAIVSLGEANSRMKDFYDICSLAERKDFNGSELKEALVETFKQRHMKFDEIVAFEAKFIEDDTRAARWNGFLKNKSVVDPMTFDAAIRIIKDFLNPVVVSIRSGSGFDKQWSHKSMMWN